MANKRALEVPIVLLLAALAIFVAAMVLALAAYLVAYLGISLVIALDFFAFAFNLVGVSNPAVGWMLAGVLFGGLLGLVTGLKKARRNSDLPLVYAATALLGLVLLLASYSNAARAVGGKHGGGLVVDEGKPTPTASANANTNTEPPQPSPTSTPFPENGMVYVPSGTFRMGRDGGDEYERPAHEVTVAPFYIDKFEVTCEEYQRFVDATKYPAPAGWRDGKYPEGSARLPVEVSWRDASAYAEWAGKRLPTEKEWEFAARGADGRLYPWGNEWKARAVNSKSTGPGRLTEVGLRPAGASPFGAFDMAGNAWEWTADSIHSYEGGKIPEDSWPTSKREAQKVIRGGGYLSNSQQATSTYRSGWPEHGADYAGTGFRCAKDVEPPAVRK